MFKIAVQGGVELERTLAGLAGRIPRDRVVQALLKGGELIRAEAARRAPRGEEPPHLDEHINLAPVREGVNPNEAAVGIGVPKEFYYDFMREFGIHGPVEPFYRPALDEQGEKAIEVVGQAFMKAVTK